MTKSRRGGSIGTVLVATAVLLASCAGVKPPPPPPQPTRVNASIEAAANVNPDVRGRPSPIVIKVYELKAPTGFNAADFFSLYERDREKLGEDVVAVEEMQLLPGDKRTYERVLQPATRHIAVLAAFRSVETAQWRATMPVDMNKLNAVSIRLEGTRVSIGKAPN